MEEDDDNWEREEQITSEEEDAYGEESWSEDYSNTDYEDDPADGDPEPEPPDYDQDNMSNESWSDEEGRHDQNSWPEETDSQFSLGDGGHEIEAEYGEFNHEEEPWSNDVGSEASYDGESKFEQEEPELECVYGEPTNHQGYEEDDETESQISLREAETETKEEPIEEAWESDHYSEIDQEEAWHEEEDFDSCQEESYHIYFSGHNQGPEAYLSWERDMEEWFQIHQVPEEERAAIAEETLTEEAFHYWDLDANIRLDYGIPDSSWEDMKQLLHEEFVGGAKSEQYYPSAYAIEEPGRWILAPTPKPKVKPKEAWFPETRNVSPNTPKAKKEAKKPAGAKQTKPASSQQLIAQTQSTKPLVEPQEQCKSSQPFKVDEITCYRCHKRGHFAATCPERKVVKSTSLGPEPNFSKSSDSLAKTDLKFFKF